MAKDQQAGTDEKSSSDRKAQEQKTILKPSVQQDEKDILDNVPKAGPSQSGHDVEQDQKQARDHGDERRTA